MQRENARDNATLPPELLKSTRHVRVNATGKLMLLTAAALTVVGIWASIELSRAADTAARYVQLFASERVLAAGDVVQLRRRGGKDDRRLMAHYRYTAQGRELTGATTLRRDDNGRYAVGSPVGVWYLPSEPEASWLDGYQPRPRQQWPATAVPFACGVAALALIHVVRRQWNLLAYGRPATATVTKVEKKRTDKGTFWVVHYEFSTLSGATRAGKYQHGKKNVPAIGDTLTIVYDRDNTFKHCKYPMAFVRVSPV